MSNGSAPVLGCIADDYTGGTDVAAALRRGGMRTVLLFGAPETDQQLADCDAVVVALKTRTIPAGEAVDTSLAVQSWFASLGISRTYVKYCSTFDSTDQGNIGPVVDAILHARNGTAAIICPASPEHGRTVYQGHLFVHDRLLSESSMRHHPLTPMTDPDLVRVLSRQTPHRVGLLPLATVRAGDLSLRAAVNDLQTGGVRHIVTDALTDEDLVALARASADLPVVTGGAGLAGAIAAVAHRGATGRPQGDDPIPGGPALILAGSCSTTTLIQVDQARKVFASHRLDPATTPDPAQLLTDALRWLDDHVGVDPVLVYSSADPDERRRAIAAMGSDTASILEETLAVAAAHAVELGVRRLIVAGGETSGAVTATLGVRQVRVGAEADRGVPWCTTIDGERLGLLLKSGNFGQPDLLVRAAGGTS
jgi:3-dehydrotetronate 4-kinase